MECSWAETYYIPFKQHWLFPNCIYRSYLKLHCLIHNYHDYFFRRLPLSFCLSFFYLFLIYITPFNENYLSDVSRGKIASFSRFLLPVKNKMGPFEGPFHVHLIFSLLKRVNFSLRWFFFRQLSGMNIVEDRQDDDDTVLK